MTRENKLALVVGFALILVVGILISDHFSTARSQKSAELGQVVDPMHPDAYANAQLIEYDTVPSAEPLLHTGHVRSSNAQRQPGQSSGQLGLMYDAVRTPPDVVRDPLADQPRRHGDTGRTVQLQPEAVEALPFIYHHIKPNETLTSISTHYFGDTSMLRDLAQYNDITDMNMVPVGLRLKIPRTAALIRGDTPTATLQQLEQLVGFESSNASNSSPTAKTYTVKKGDTLGEISLRVLGTSKKWRTLYEYNKDVIRNPDRVLEGTVLKIPPG